MYLYLAFIGIMTALFIGTIGINRIIDIFESKQTRHKDKKKEGGKEV